MFSANEYRSTENLNVDSNEIKPLSENNSSKTIHVGDYVKKY